MTNGASNPNDESSDRSVGRTLICRLGGPLAGRSANGAVLYQPRATPRERHPTARQGLKARAIRRAVRAGFQPSWMGETVTQGVAPGWNKAGALPLGKAAPAALDAERAEVLG